MRPIRLEMKGFSAFAAATVVDFSGVELAALIGPTGSGKSSIIDAMTFALYGSVARYDERLVAPIINQMAQEARVRFDFEVAGTPWIAVRVARRTKGGGATTKEARLESAGVVLAADARSVTEQVTTLLGLDFGRFNKTVVLPQGKFAEFLHDKPSARQELLRELLGFAVHERIGRAARERAKAAENRADILEQSLGDMGDTSDARLAAGEATAAAIATLQTDVEVAAAELVTLTGHLDVAARDGQAHLVAIAALAVVRMPDGLSALDANLSAARLAGRAAGVAWEETRRRLHAASEAQMAGPSASSSLLRLRDFDQHQRRSEQHEQIVTRRAAAQLRHESAQVEANVTRAALQTQRAVVAECSRRRAELDDALRAIGEQSELRAVLDAYARQTLLAHEVDGLAQTALARKTDEVAATRLLAVAREQLAEIERRIPATVLASRLTLGEACPVCGQEVHDLPDTAASVADLSGPQALVEQAQRHAVDCERRAQAAAADVSVCERERLQLDRRLKDRPTKQDIATRLVRCEELHEQVEQHRHVVRGAERALAATESSADHRARLAEEVAAAHELAAATALESQSSDEISQLQRALHTGPTHRVVLENLDRANTLAEAKTDAEQAERQAAEQYGAVQIALAGLGDDERKAREGFEGCRITLAAWGPPKTGSSLAADWQVLAAWADVQRTNHEGELHIVRADERQLRADREALIARVAERAAPFVGLRNDRDTLTGRITERAAPFVGSSAGTAGTAGTIAAIARMLAAAGSSADHELRQLTKDRQRYAKMQAEVATLRTDAAVAGILGHQLRTSGFERWLLEEALADLVGRATVRLHELTGGQYSLVAEDGSFRIIDHHNADERRDARSLSGGETFLASLALALALADSALDLSAEGAAPIESIFLDEGFGTLDPDTLEVVAGTIEELGASGRLVGIVTHIRELADRMPTRFDVRKDSSGSSVTRVDL